MRRSLQFRPLECTQLAWKQMKKLWWPNLQYYFTVCPVTAALSLDHLLGSEQLHTEWRLLAEGLNNGAQHQMCWEVEANPTSPWQIATPHTKTTAQNEDKRSEILWCKTGITHKMNTEWHQTPGQHKSSLIHESIWNLTGHEIVLKTWEQMGG